MANTISKKNKFEIIPAIDIIDGKCVRLSQGDYAEKKIYNEHPLEVALEFENAGIKRLHLVDLDGAKNGKVKNWKVLEKIATKTKLVVDFGGGIKSVEDVDIVLNSGAAFATIGSMAVKEKDLFKMMLMHFGSNKFLLGADVKEEKIAIGGWLEQTDVDILDFIKEYKTTGIQQFFCTDISKDGMLQGPAIDLYKKLIKEIKGIDLIASGGVSVIDDVHQLNEIGCSGVIIGKAIYENRISLQQLQEFL